MVADASFPPNGQGSRLELMLHMMRGTIMGETINNRTRRVVMHRAERSRCRMPADTMQGHCLAPMARRARLATASRRIPPGVATGGDRVDPRSNQLTGAEPLLFVSARAADGMAWPTVLPGPVAADRQGFAQVWTITRRLSRALPTPFMPDRLEPAYASEADGQALPMRRIALTPRHRAGNVAGSGRPSCVQAGSICRVVPAPWRAHAA